MKILVACEESQAVCKAFREKGHEAYSCDIIECSGGRPEWHIQQDVLPLINGNCDFLTCDNKWHEVEGKWDMVIAFPPCTHLAVSGARHFEKKRADGRQRWGIEFFCQFLNADCEKIVIENPVGIISGDYIKQWFPDLAKEYNLPIKPSQIIQPYEYGHPAKKSTCLWIKGDLPLLQPTKIVEPEILTYTCKSGKKVNFSKDYCHNFNWNDAIDRSKTRSKTYTGIAEAMAEQWG
jgi:site-specific DNA-cytosine methylase